MDEVRQWVPVFVIFAGLIGTWAVIKSRSDQHDADIKGLKEQATRLDREVVRLDATQAAQSQRVDGLIEEIRAMERRILDTLRQFLDASRRD